MKAVHVRQEHAVQVYAVQVSSRRTPSRYIVLRCTLGSMCRAAKYTAVK
jgi:hypothetical protein